MIPCDECGDDITKTVKVTNNNGRTITKKNTAIFNNPRGGDSYKLCIECYWEKERNRPTRKPKSGYKKIEELDKREVSKYEPEG